MDQQDNSTSYLPGGTVRVTTSMSDTPATEVEHQEFGGQGVVNGGGSLGGGQTTNIGSVTRVNSSEIAPNLATAGTILSTIRNQAGHPVPYSRATPEHTVELEPGNPYSRTSLDVAERLGYVIRTQQGEWQMPSVTPDQAEQAIVAQNTKAEEAAVERFNNADAENLMRPDVHGIPENVFTAELAKAAGGTQPDINKLATLSGKPAAYVSYVVTALQASFNGQAVRAATESGVSEADFPNFSAWCQQNRADD